MRINMSTEYAQADPGHKLQSQIVRVYWTHEITDMVDRISLDKDCSRSKQAK
jgi:hypothetical protein